MPAPGTNVLFTGRDLFTIIWPLIMEQALSLTIGMADTAMVTRVSSAALSGVSLVDAINVVLVQLFSALATGGAVVCSQYLGRGDENMAREAGRQLTVLCVMIALIIAALAVGLRGLILQWIYGSVEPDVMASAMIYFALTAMSYPFLGMYNSGAALFRSMGKTSVTLAISVGMNVINVAGNAITIYGFGMGAAGAGLATLLSRAAGGLIIMILIRNRKHVLWVRNYVPRLNADIVKRILRIGVPSGFENSMFSFGKLLVSSLVSSLGTIAIAANAVGHNIAILQDMPAAAINMAMLTVIGRAIGAGQRDEAKRYTRILMLTVYAGNDFITLITLLFAGPIINMFGLEAAGVPSAIWIVLFHGSFALLFWPLSFSLPCALRAAGDVKYTMLVSVISMWIVRVGGSYLIAGFGLGLKSVWIAMILDWLVRGGFFVARYLSGRWLDKKVV